MRRHGDQDRSSTFAPPRQCSAPTVPLRHTNLVPCRQYSPAVSTPASRARWCSRYDRFLHSEAVFKSQRRGSTLGPEGGTGPANRGNPPPNLSRTLDTVVNWFSEKKLVKLMPPDVRFAQNSISTGAPPQTSPGSIQWSPEPLAVFKGPTSKGREEDEGRGRKRREPAPPPNILAWTSPQSHSDNFRV